MSRYVNALVIHHSATPDGVLLGVDGGCAAQVIDCQHFAAGVRRAHPSINPQLSAIGYHFVIDCDGVLLTGCGEEEPVSYASSRNSTAIGICLVGTSHYTLAQWLTLHDLVARLLDKYRNATVSGHHDYVSADSPGFTVWDWVDGGMVPLSGHVVSEGV